ncbi:hypothetical protein D4764_10G0010530 [Takifugu flavidus]|uniref:Uncharacterized protein n=1 Tax=Takifugu flavidus TaxID=433684 RepID=A0A5C6PKX6_9TELE|nr:hypothetical protein D4764_10G0010530 [Takifugu flavidus]
MEVSFFAGIAGKKTESVESTVVVLKSQGGAHQRPRLVDKIIYNHKHRPCGSPAISLRQQLAAAEELSARHIETHTDSRVLKRGVPRPGSKNINPFIAKTKQLSG